MTLVAPSPAWQVAGLSPVQAHTRGRSGGTACGLYTVHLMPEYEMGDNSKHAFPGAYFWMPSQAVPR
jgi:hypothetical protein